MILDAYLQFLTESLKKCRVQVLRLSKGNFSDTRLDFGLRKQLGLSEEYDSFAKGPEEDVSSEEFLGSLAEAGNGKLIGDLGNPYEIFEGFVTDLDKHYDPRVLFLILAIVLFLLDVAVRKFKFKWPHEIIRTIRDKRNYNK